VTARDPACDSLAYDSWFWDEANDALWQRRRLIEMQAELDRLSLALRDALREMVCRMLLERVAELRGRGS
jgi:hypothetical protein